MTQTLWIDWNVGKSSPSPLLTKNFKFPAYCLGSKLVEELFSSFPSGLECYPANLWVFALFSNLMKSCLWLKVIDSLDLSLLIIQSNLLNQYCAIFSYSLQHELMKKGKLVDRKNANIYIVLTGKKTSGRARSSLLIH